MEGIIKIEEFKIHCILGAHAYEREDEQEISVDIALKTNILECTQTDSIVDTIDYREVAKVCNDLAKERAYHLLETLAFEMIHAIMSTFSPDWVKIIVRKRRALPLAKEAAVELELSK